MAYFSTDPDLSVASILETVADRSALEQVFHDVKEVHGAGQQQLRHVWANVGAWNLIGWWHTLVELWAWDRPQSRLRDRSDSPWDKPERRPSHANRCQELRREALQEEYSSLPSVGGLRQKSAGSFSASCAESHEADSSGKVQLLASYANPVIVRGCLTGEFIPAFTGEIEHSATLRERPIVTLLGVRLIADSFPDPFAGQIMASEQPDLDFLPGVLSQECSVPRDECPGLDLERVKYGLAV